MTRIGRTARGLGVLALAVPLSGVALLLSAGPASAGGGFTAPGSDGVVFSDPHASIQIATNVTGTKGEQLTLTSPSGTTQTLGSKTGTLGNNDESIRYTFDPSAAPTLNGTWTATLSGDVSATRTFILRIAPAAPTGLSARADGYRAVVLSWTKGDEPDLTGWTLYADGGPQGDLGTDVCSGTSCSTTVTYSQDGTGQHTYSLVAHRRTAPGSSDTLDSPQSSQASATLDSPPPPPPPSPAPAAAGSGGSPGGSTGGSSSSGSSSSNSTGSGGSTSSSTGGSTSSSTGSSNTSNGTNGGKTGSSAISSSKAPVTIAQRRAFALTFQAFAPKLGIPKLPPLPDAQPVVAPLPFGTYQKTLGYKDVVKTEQIPGPQATVRRVTGVVGSALDSTQFLKSIAGALVLLLAAAHLRRWLGSHSSD